MKPYPSIARSTSQQFREFEAYVFDKLDGSNIRVEWTRKAGWHKFGTRNRLFDHTDPDFGIAIPIFLSHWQESLTKIAHDARWDQVTAFFEFWGPSSFAGKHDPDDVKTLTLFDLAVHKKGILGPREFLDRCDGLRIPKFFGIWKWTRGFVERVRLGERSLSVTFEGVVGKGGSGHKLVMAKAKTQAWIDKVVTQYGAEDGKKILES